MSGLVHTANGMVRWQAWQGHGKGPTAAPAHLAGVGAGGLRDGGEVLEQVAPVPAAVLSRSSMRCAGITICFRIMSPNAIMLPLGSLRRAAGQDQRQVCTAA